VDGKVIDSTIFIVLRAEATRHPALNSHDLSCNSITPDRRIPSLIAKALQKPMCSNSGSFPCIVFSVQYSSLGSAGTGLLGIVFSPLVRLYTVTDLDVLLPLIRKNISLAFPDWCQAKKPGSNISVQELDWLAVQAATPTSRARLLPTDLDLILVVDCVYHPFLLPALVETIDSLTVSERTTVMVVAELRADDVIREFLSLWASKRGWVIRRANLLGIRFGTWVGWRDEVLP
jgi:hypothetical protein